MSAKVCKRLCETVNGTNYCSVCGRDAGGAVEADPTTLPANPPAGPAAGPKTQTEAEVVRMLRSKYNVAISLLAGAHPNRDIRTS